MKEESVVVKFFDTSQNKTIKRDDMKASFCSLITIQNSKMKTHCMRTDGGKTIREISKTIGSND